jgi:hypothetical protein
VHALVELAPAAGGGQHVPGVAQARAAEHRVVDAQFEVAVRAGERRQRVHALERRQLVHQHPHAHAAPRGGEQLLEEQLAGVVLVEDVGLQVDAVGGAVQQVEAGDERVLAAVEDQCVVARRRRRALGEGARAQRVQRGRARAGVGLRALDRLGARRQRHRLRLRALGRAEGAAAAQRRQRERQHGPGEAPHRAGSAAKRMRRVKRTRSSIAMRQRPMP